MSLLKKQLCLSIPNTPSSKSFKLSPKKKASNSEEGKRWFDELKIHVLFMEDLESDLLDYKPSKPPRFYVKSCIRGQKLPMKQKTEAKEPTTSNDGTTVSWYYPMDFKICIQSLFQSPCFEFRLMRALKNKILVDEVIGVVRVPVEKLYNHKVHDTLRLPIMSMCGKKSKGFLRLSKVIKL